MISATVLILAGNRPGEKDVVAEAAGTSCKAFAKIGGIPMIERVIKTLNACPAIKKMIVSLPKHLSVDAEAPVLAMAIAKGQIMRLDSQLSPTQSLEGAIEFVEMPLLVTTADHALLSVEMVQSILNQFDAKSFDAAAGMVPLDLVKDKYPQIRRTSLNFCDGSFKGSNLFVFSNRQSAERILNFWKKMEAHRKNPLRMAKMLGLVPLIRYLSGSMTLEDAFKRIGKLTATKIRPVLLYIPEAALDVDTVEDYNFMQSQV